MAQDNNSIGGKQGRRWCFTINNDETNGDQLLQTFSAPNLPNGVRYVVWQQERGELGTLHLQGFIEFTANWRMRRVVDLLGGHAHVEIARGSAQQNRDYCTKEQSRVKGPFEFGQIAENGGGKGKPLQQATQMINEGKSLKQVAAALPEVYVRNGRGLRELKNALAKKTLRKVKVICIIGGTGIGKTWWVYNNNHWGIDEIYKPLYGNSGMWWDHYEGEKVLFLDEFKAQIPLQKLLQILDIYPFQSEVKGSSISAAWETVVICSNSPPDSWYPNMRDRSPDEYMALRRRVGLLPDQFPDQDSHYVQADNREALQWQLEKLFPQPDTVIIPMVDNAVVPPRENSPQLWDEQDQAEMDQMLNDLALPQVQTPVLIDDEADVAGLNILPVYTSNMCDTIP